MPITVTSGLEQHLLLLLPAQIPLKVTPAIDITLVIIGY